MKKIYVSDTTLCDSERKALSFRERLNLASRLEKAGVDALELPVLSGGKEDAVICRTIASSVSCKVCIATGDTPEALAAAHACIRDAKDGCLQVVLPVSTVQMEYHYHLKADKMPERIRTACAAAAALCPQVEFVARDASRADPDFVRACCQAAAAGGATAVTLCDDGSVLFPEEFAALVRHVRIGCALPLFVQPGNGLYMAAACAVQALLAGADGIKTASECAHRLGADQLAHMLRAKGDSLGLSCGLDVTAISQLLSGFCSQAAAPMAPAAGDANLYLDETCSLADIATAVGSLGYELTEADLGKVYAEFTRVCARKKAIGTKELEAIIATAAMQVPSTYHLVSYVVNSGNIITATANITLEKDGQQLSGVSIGDGPIDAAFHAIEQIIGHHYELDDLQIQSVTKGREAVGSSLIRLRADGVLYSGNGISTDIVGACIRAYINALNKIIYEG